MTSNQHGPYVRGDTRVTFGGAVNMHLGIAKLYIGADRIFGDMSKEFIPIDNMNGQVNVGITVPF